MGATLLPRKVMASSVPVPNPKTLQSGDFVWPKKAGTFVPYDAGPPIDPNADETKWTQERDRFIADVSTKARMPRVQCDSETSRLFHRTTGLAEI